MLVRNVGHLMTIGAVLDRDGNEAFEGILDGVFTVLIGMHDLKGNGRYRNSRAGTIYIVKPKMHGPEEVALPDTLFARMKDASGLPLHQVERGRTDQARREATRGGGGER